MITINGVLTVKQISGANGKFCTGDLSTSIGEFKVKESILDQFEEGRYEGEFVIESFYLSSYVWRGKSTTDIRAKVTDIRLDTADEGEVDNTVPEPDPVNEAAAAQSTVQPSTNVESENSTESKTVVADSYKLTNDAVKDYENLVPIVGVELIYQIANHLPVKLDPTVDRALFRQQRDVLKEHGYLFDAITQSWTRKAVNHD